MKIIKSNNYHKRLSKYRKRLSLRKNQQRTYVQKNIMADMSIYANDHFQKASKNEKNPENLIVFIRE